MPGKRKLEFLSTVMAHRGGALERMENTLPAFQRAFELGAHLLELDVQETSDGEVVIFHDKTFERLCGVQGRVQDTAFHSLPRLRLPRHFDPLKTPDGLPWTRRDLEIPLLKDLLSMVPSSVPMQIDLKAGGPSLVSKTIRLIEEHGREKTTLLGSFHSSTASLLAKATENGSQIPLFLPWPRVLLLYTAYRLGFLEWLTIHESALIIPNIWLFRDLEFIQIAQEEFGLSVLVFGQMNSESDFEEWYQGFKVDGLCTDRPKALLDWLSNGTKS